ncbi:glycine--tRNA ligase subunit beta [bacterium]|nr:glycine--tRNA ligase subunit beta [bacterium]MBU1613998.1 glycine--tRNA ligase subunit beta [bacterium]
MRKDMLLEIGTEEIPAGYIQPALWQMERLAKNLLESERIGFGEVKTFGTPRRLALFVKGVSTSGEERIVEIVGPPKRVAFEKCGEPAKAGFGFAKSQGVEVGQLKIKETQKGEYVYVEKKLAGKETKEFLREVMPKIITSLSFAKSMCWGEGSLRFGRPIRWILSLFDRETVEFSLDGLSSGNLTFGHRFLSSGAIKVDRPDQYLEKLSQAFCIANQEERREIVFQDLKRLAKEEGGEPLIEEGLLDEVTCLVEYPRVLLGHFEEEFLALPGDVLIASMTSHQRYFPVADKEGKLLPAFLVVSNNTQAADREITCGNQRVLRARLADAQFFFNEDRKVSLEERVEQERQVIFEERLGSLYDKTERIVKLAGFITSSVDSALVPVVERAAFLSKADLLTEMVGEFPKLQGIMGYHYALAQGEEKEVAEAIKEQYLPLGAKDSLPETLCGAILSLADKLDTIAGSFSIGLIPTGSEDPYGLRRQAQGAVNIILDKKLSLSLRLLINKALKGLGDKVREEEKKPILLAVLDFFAQRMRYILTEKGLELDEVEAVLAVGFDNLVETEERAKALNEVRVEADFESLSIGFKRAVNILKKGIRDQGSGIRRELLREKAEEELYSRYLEIESEVKGLLRKRNYQEALKILATLREPIDNFFDQVMVMVEDKDLCLNRLFLLKLVTDLFLKIADFSYLKNLSHE